MTQFKPPEPLNFENPKWDEWIKNFNIYRIITELDKKPAKIQVLTLKYCMGIKCDEIIKTMNISEEESKNYETMVTKLNQYFKPKRNEIRLRRTFNNRKRQQGEDIEAYLRELYKLAEDCNFVDKNDRIRDQFIVGLNDEDLIEKLEID